jgi:hypothetical protein
MKYDPTAKALRNSSHRRFSSSIPASDFCSDPRPTEFSWQNGIGDLKPFCSLKETGLGPVVSCDQTQGTP